MPARTPSKKTKSTPSAKKVTKAIAATKKRTASKKVEKPQTLRLSKETQSFISTGITRQTIYWVILSVVILVTGLYIIQLQLSILNTLEQLESSSRDQLTPAVIRDKTN